MKQFFLAVGVLTITGAAVNAQSKPKTTVKPKAAVTKSTTGLLKTKQLLV